MKKFLITVTLILIFTLTAVGCGMPNGSMGGIGGDYFTPDENFTSSGENYEYNKVVEKPFYNTLETPSSYFSLDRNTATYSLVRRQINAGYKISENSIRIEEMINYFDYGYPAPTSNSVGISTYLTDCPWNANNKIMLIGVKTKEVKVQTQKNNYVFLVDVSGSMHGADRIGLVKYSINKLVDNFTENDRVSIVTYASGVKTALESTICSDENKQDIKNTVNNLLASGSTNGSGGLNLAYSIAKEQHQDGVNSRVILMSDGDFNVGISNEDTLKEIIQDYAKEDNIYLSVLGFGMGNTRDDILETLAVNGNGNYAYIDCETEAEKVLIKELDGTLKTVAKDAKAGVTFNSENVSKYRLIGYDAKYITEEEFNNTQKDTGEIGSNLCVTAMYEITLNQNANGNLATATVKYKDTEDNNLDKEVKIDVTTSSPDGNNVKFATAVAYFGLLLRNSEYKCDASFNGLLTYLNDLSNYISGDVYKEEFISLVSKASEIY